MIAIYLQHLSVSIEQKKLLSDISLSIPKASRVAIIGPNGAGKSTLLNALLGLTPMRVDAYKLWERDMALLSRKTLAQQISYIPQHQDIDPYLTPFAWCEMARFPHQKWGFDLKEEERALIEKALMITNTLHLKDNKMQHLSGGERQRVYIAGAICQETPLIFLDEPNNFLDPKYSKEITQLIRQIAIEQDKTLLCVTHDVNQLKDNFTHILALKEGEIAFWGETKEMVTLEKMNQLFDYQFQIAKYENQEFFF